MISFPKMHPDWRNILAKAWSVKLLWVAMVLTALQVYLELTVESGQNVVLTACTGLITAAAFGARLLAQSNMENADGESKSTSTS